MAHLCTEGPSDTTEVGVAYYRRLQMDTQTQQMEGVTERRTTLTLFFSVWILFFLISDCMSRTFAQKNGGWGWCLNTSVQTCLWHFLSTSPCPLPLFSPLYLWSVSWSLQMSIFLHVYTCLPSFTHFLASNALFAYPRIPHCRPAQLLLWLRLELFTVWTQSDRKKPLIHPQSFLFLLNPSVSLVFSSSYFVVHQQSVKLLSVLSSERLAFKCFLTWREAIPQTNGYLVCLIGLGKSYSLLSHQFPTPQMSSYYFYCQISRDNILPG